MEVYVYVKFSQDKDTGEEQLEVPEVYATKEAAEWRYNNAVCEVQEEIDEDEPISEMDDRGDYFIFDSDWRYVCIYYKKVEVK